MTQCKQRCNENKRIKKKKDKIKTIIHAIVKCIVCISEQSF